MAIGRPQMEEQIKGFAEAGAVDGTADMTDIDKQLELIREMTALVTARNEQRKSDPSQFLRQSGPPDPATLKKISSLKQKLSEPKFFSEYHFIEDNGQKAD